jgi:predicted Zn-dependent protease with MMP-like domain
VTFEEFESFVNASVKEIPKNFTEILDKNQIKVLAREKAPNELKNNYKGKIVFGIFIGVPLGHFYNMSYQPTRIELYQDSFEQIYHNPDDIKKQILITVIHEIAHYFGFSEDEIRKLGY